MRICKSCGEQKSLSRFPVSNYIKGKKYYKYKCYNCISEQTKVNHWKSRISTNITIELFNTLFKKQNGCCAICNTKISLYNEKENKNLTAVLDHCHITNQVRGLLCNNCNRALGLFKDNLDNLEQAVSYLAKWKPNREKN